LTELFCTLHSPGHHLVLNFTKTVIWTDFRATESVITNLVRFG
jgi:hypothetical protein